MTLGFKPRRSEFVDWKSTLPFVIPAQAGIQVLSWPCSTSKGWILGLRRHDKLSLRLKAGEINQPREGH
jgi:hypothetical protein